MSTGTPQSHHNVAQQQQRQNQNQQQTLQPQMQSLIMPARDIRNQPPIDTTNLNANLIHKQLK